jgi:hypothetical protein
MCQEVEVKCRLRTSPSAPSLSPQTISSSLHRELGQYMDCDARSPINPSQKTGLYRSWISSMFRNSDRRRGEVKNRSYEVKTIARKSSDSKAQRLYLILGEANSVVNLLLLNRSALIYP